MGDAGVWKLAADRRAEFDASAADYDRYRPRYPDSLFDELVGLAGLAPGDAAIEIGAGTGIASLPLVERGLRLTALEPALGMARIASQKLDGRGEILVQRFEDFSVQEPVSLVAAFNSWHWVEPGPGIAALERTLRPGGILAVVWSEVVQWGQEPFETTMFELAGWSPSRTMTPALVDSLEPLGSSGLFGDFEVRRYRLSRDLDAQTYIEGTRTYGSTQPDWEDAVRRAIERGLRRGGDQDRGRCPVLVPTKVI